MMAVAQMCNMETFFSFWMCTANQLGDYWSKTFHDMRFASQTLNTSLEAAAIRLRHELGSLLDLYTLVSTYP